jgi:CheY-like chemotaxis protein
MYTESEPRQTRILLCDDSPVERLALAHFLRGTGYSVDEAGDGDAAILHMKHREVDLILLDLHMPEVDGFGVLSYIQEHRRSLPVILLSGMPLHRIQHKMHELPTPELPPLLLKPIDPDQLLAMIDLQMSGQMPDLGSDEGEAQPERALGDDTSDGTYRR